MTNTRSAILPLLLLASLAAACSSVTVGHDYDPDTDFGALKTYAWIDPPAGASVDPLAYRRVVDGADSVLATKGFRMDPAAPDFLVAAHLGTQRKVRVDDYGYGYRRGPGGFGARDLEVTEYEEGTLVLDVVLAGSKELVWRGTARGTIDPSATPEERTERIREAVEKVLEPFPPR